MIEFADATEAEALAHLHASAFERPWDAAEITTLLANRARFALLARTPAPSGFIIAAAAGGEAEILTLAVAPDARRNGLGAALVEAAAGAAARRDASALFLEVAEDNHPARALYAKLGFETAGGRPDYYAGAKAGVSAIIMRRALPFQGL